MPSRVPLVYRRHVPRWRIAHTPTRNGFAGIEHSRSSHNDIIANNTSYDNQYNCYFSGLFGGGDTTIGMVDNVYENNICASKVSTEYGLAMAAELARTTNQVWDTANIHWSTRSE